MIISERALFLFGNFFSQKVKLFVNGQKDVFSKLKSCNLGGQKLVWFHVSSLGEYEQALPVMEKMKQKYPAYKIVLSFFSPSGYEIKKTSSPADCVVYLPVDTRKNVRRFLDIIQPELVFFVKYDFWPNYLFELKKRKIKTYLVSGLFTDKHKFFRWYNAWLKKSLLAFTTFFVQDENSKNVLQYQGFNNVSVCGDTRFDRVFQIAEKLEKLDFIAYFKGNKDLFIAGSSWETGEDFITNYLKKDIDFKTIIAPHDISENHIKKIVSKLPKSYILYTDIKFKEDLKNKQILVLNTIGLLNKAYRYADWVYIGGGFGKSIHNIQEPAVFGVPIITGPKIKKFNEAVDLQKLGGLLVVNNQNDFDKTMDLLASNIQERKKCGKVTKDYALKNVGATEKIFKQIGL